MRRIALFTLILLSWTSLAHAAVGAVTTNHEGRDSQASTDPALSQEAIDRELDKFRKTEVSLHQALRIAEKIHPGSRTADISFEGGLDVPVYKVRTLQSGQIWESDIDGATAKVLNTALFSTVQGLNETDRTSLAALDTISLRMSDAIKIAERSAAGKAISGGLTTKDGKVAFIIVVVCGKNLKQVTLEPTLRRR
ncbi:PepSY domain-containing protein [Bradyrhizobium sp. HKCCYLRH3099]|uniref:PepSY domain-containing protein n=1 Tax=unclassified Bradyrhizobium TaxID=2631580 RepID=UPI003EB7AD6F